MDKIDTIEVKGKEYEIDSKKIGELTSLNTENKNTIVEAINEIKNDAQFLSSKATTDRIYITTENINVYFNVSIDNDKSHILEPKMPNEDLVFIFDNKQGHFVSDSQTPYVYINIKCKNKNTYFAFECADKFFFKFSIENVVPIPVEQGIETDAYLPYSNGAYIEYYTNNYNICVACFNTICYLVNELEL